MSPEDIDVPRAKSEDLRGGDPAYNAAALKRVLQGERNAYRDIAVFNAAAALVVADAAPDLRAAAALATRALDSGEALSTLERLVALSNA